MADTKTSALPDAGAIAGTEIVPVVQSGSNRKLSLSALLTWIAAALAAAARLVPTGGTNGQVLRANVDGDPVFETVGLVPAGSVMGYVLRQTGSGPYDHGWGAVRELPEVDPGGLDTDKLVKWDGGAWVYAFAPDQSAGSEGQLQYKATGGGFAGATNAWIGASGSLELAVDAAPTTPASTKVGACGVADGGQTALGWVATDGRIERAAPRAKRRAGVYVIPGGATPTSVGVTTSAEGTVAGVAINSAALPKSAIGRVSYSTAASAGSSAGLRFAQTYLYRGADASSGGFNARFLFAAADAAPVADRRCFVGLIGSGGVFGNVNPSSKLNCVAIGADSGEADLSIIHNDGSGTANKISLTGWAQADTAAVYELELWCAPGASNVHYRATKRTAGSAPVVLQGAINSELPAANQLLTHYVWVNNGVSTDSATVEFMGLEVERDV